MDTNSFFYMKLYSSWKYKMECAMACEQGGHKGCKCPACEVVFAWNNLSEDAKMDLFHGMLCQKFSWPEENE